jgi:hypothetical protein
MSVTERPRRQLRGLVRESVDFAFSAAAMLPGSLISLFAASLRRSHSGPGFEERFRPAPFHSHFQAPLVRRNFFAPVTLPSLRSQFCSFLLRSTTKKQVQFDDGAGTRVSALVVYFLWPHSVRRKSRHGKRCGRLSLRCATIDRARRSEHRRSACTRNLCVTHHRLSPQISATRILLIRTSVLQNTFDLPIGDEQIAWSG